MKKLELQGQCFDRWLVLEEAGRNKWGAVLWKCLCDCGVVKVVIGKCLRNGESKSCGCLKKEITSKTKKINLTGQKFGRLLVLEEVGGNKRQNILWKCQCGCGNIKVVCGIDLRSGNTKSCGCLRNEKVFEVGKNNYNPDLTDEERQIRREYPDYKEWRAAVYERDNYTCQCCGDSRGGNLCAHHLESYADNPDLRILLENGITLCEECHKNFHHQYGYGNNTIEQFEKFFLYTERFN